MQEKKKNKQEMGEDATKYGEFVCSAYHWLSPEDQKKQANEMQRMTDKNKGNKKKS